jgi:hypothetical protein
MPLPRALALAPETIMLLSEADARAVHHFRSARSASVIGTPHRPG